MISYSYQPLQRTISGFFCLSGVHHSEAKQLLQDLSLSCPLSPVAADCLTFFFPWLSGQKWLHDSVPPKHLLSCRALHNPTGNHAQHLANTCWCDWMQWPRRQKHISERLLPLITAALAFPRQLLGTCDNPAFVSRALCWKGQENILVKPDFWRWLLSQEPEAGNH